jgi:hypothetical protein
MLINSRQCKVAICKWFRGIIKRNLLKATFKAGGYFNWNFGTVATFASNLTRFIF